MNVKLEDLMPDVEMKPPYPAADVDELISDFIAVVGPIPHPDYVDLIRRHAGGAGPIGTQNYLVLWPIDDVVLQTTIFEKTARSSRLLLFAGDGGDTVFAFDRSDPSWPIISLPLTSASPEDRKSFAPTFSELIKRLAADESPL